MIDSVTVKQVYNGDGSTTNFPFSFPFIASTDVKVAIYVVETEQETQLTSDYYVDSVGHKVVYPGYPPGEAPPLSQQPGPLPVGQRLVIYRSTPISQLKDLGDKYPLPFIEEMVDKNTMILQEQGEKLDRAVLVDMGGGITPQDVSYDIKHLKEYKDAAEESKNAAAASETAAASYATQSENYALQASDFASQAEDSLESTTTVAQTYSQEGRSILDSAAQYARQAAEDAAGIHESAAPPWNAEAVYSYPDTVVYTDGATYRCIGTDVPAGTLPTASPAWVRITAISGDDYFEIDLYGGIMPRVNPKFSPSFDLDENGAIMPKGLDDEITLAATTAAETAAQTAYEQAQLAAGSAQDAADSAGAAADDARDAADALMQINLALEQATLLELADEEGNITTKEAES